MEQNETDSYFETPAVKAHKQQRTWQIIFPVVLVSILLLAGLVFLILRNGRFSPGLAEVSGAATVLVILPVLFGSLLFLAILAFIIYGLGKLKAVIPHAGLKVLQFMEKARWKIRKGADISVQPIVSLTQNSAKAKQVIQSLNARIFDKRN
ncbi:MAG: hypothetical protein PHW11_03910 [Anaerolineaceae bacterium]|jgi:predicted membrane protein|nr:hypothetical protein [Anaerolineaceae bacterium]MDD4042636.1 hypothetical protein [Anaerolineaceae bacterium]MDD4577811.1 hypothetical protein [Anaerolineaceae bacterium]